MYYFNDELEWCQTFIESIKIVLHTKFEIGFAAKKRDQTI